MRNRYTNLGWLTTIVVAILPIIIWLTTQQTDWSSSKLIVENLGKLAGLAGLSLFAFNVILSARLKLYDKLFLGLDNTYRAHHIIGSTAFILLLIHPMLITTRYLLSSPIAAYEFLKPAIESPFKTLGSFTLGLMIVAMIVTLYVWVKQETFVKVQRILGLLLFLGGIHAIFVGGSDVRSLFWLQLYILTLLTLSAAVYIYRSLFHKNFHKYYDYKISNVVHKNDIIELHMAPTDKKLDYLPGQFAFVKLDQKGVLGEIHPFSISSNPAAQNLRFSIKQLGDYTGLLSDVKAGQSVKVDGPYGTFSNKVVNNNDQVWVAGGIGVTPFLAMAANLDDSQKVTMFYSVKTANEAVYKQDLQEIAKQKTNFRLIVIESDKDGMLTSEIILSKSKTTSETTYMICGPGAMMKALRSQLRTGGVANKNIHTEEFSLL